MRKIFIVLLLSSGACGTTAPSIETKGVENDTDATAAYSALTSSLAKMMVVSRPAGDSKTAEEPSKCPDGGSGKTKVTMDDEVKENPKYRVELDLSDCQSGAHKVTGHLVIEGETVVAPDHVDTKTLLNGSVAYVGPTYAGTFRFDAMKLIIGTDPGALGVSMTGRFSIGGKSYEINEETYTKAANVRVD